MVYWGRAGACAWCRLGEFRVLVPDAVQYI